MFVGGAAAAAAATTTTMNNCCEQLGSGGGGGDGGNVTMCYCSNDAQLPLGGARTHANSLVPSNTDAAAAVHFDMSINCRRRFCAAAVVADADAFAPFFSSFLLLLPSVSAKKVHLSQMICI